MEEIFNILSSAARFKKAKNQVKDKQAALESHSAAHSCDDNEDGPEVESTIRSRDRTGKRDKSNEKLEQIHREQISAFRRSMGIRIANKHDHDVPEPISSFQELEAPKWWRDREGSLTTFESLSRIIFRNVEAGRWKEPTPIQMQAVPTLLSRRDIIGAAPTGSGKSGAFILPTLFLSGAPYDVFYHSVSSPSEKNTKKKAKNALKSLGKQGEIRALLLAPSLELASQLHREVERIGMGIRSGGRSAILLSKANAMDVISGQVGGKHGLDVLVSTPLRLVDCTEKGLRLESVRCVIIDEADRLLDATDGKHKKYNEENDEDKQPASGSAQTKTFLAQMDIILSQIPVTAVRGLFSATVTPTVRTLSESILRNPVDVTIQVSTAPGGANRDIEQKLTFVGKEEGKLLAIRQLVQRGELRPPVLVFVQSQERAQALFGELLYDGIHVDVIHAGRSKSARENSVAKFRRGDTWVLICTDVIARGVDFRAVKMVINYDLPESGVTYIHRIGRTGRAGRKGTAITLFTEADFPNLRTIANIMKQSGCQVEDWMLNMARPRSKTFVRRRREDIDTTPKCDRIAKRKKRQIIEQSKKKKINDNAECTK